MGLRQGAMMTWITGLDWVLEGHGMACIQKETSAPRNVSKELNMERSKPSEE